MAGRSPKAARRRARREQRERGFVIVWMAIVLVLLLSIAALGVDLVHAYAEAQHLQNAVDAAALGGAVELPAVGSDQHAKDDATNLLEKNGYDPADPSNKLDLGTFGRDKTPGLENQMDVTESHTFPTLFGRIIGFDTITVKKTAHAQYDPPIAMGSPANNLGDVPECPPGTPAFPGCLSDATTASQRLWVSAQGAGGFKQQGNAITTQNCDVAPSENVDGCNGSANIEYNPKGESFQVQNDQTGNLDIWVYDPGFVHTGVDCSQDASSWNNLNPTDLAVFTNYAKPLYCPGDARLSGAQQFSPALDTTFKVVDTDGQTVDCQQTFPGYDIDQSKPPPLNSAPNVLHALGPGNVTYQGFHQWYHLCTIPNAQVTLPGQEYQVNVTTGGGLFTNQFSLLALHGNVAPGATSQMSVFARKELPLVAVDPNVVHDGSGNVVNPPTFYLARVLPSTKDRVLEVDFFDLGDTSLAPNINTGKLSILAKNVTGVSTFSNCQWVPVPSATSPPQPPPPFLTGFVDSPCTWSYNALNGADPTWDGRWVAIQIPIPAAGSPGGWNCDETVFQNCWIQLQMAPDGPNVSDATTWKARVVGSPVRLVR